MTTGLVAGLSLQRAAEVVAAKAAEQLQPGQSYAVWTEVGASTVLVGIATPEAAGTIAINRSEYDGLKLMEILNGHLFPQGPAGLAAAGRR